MHLLPTPEQTGALPTAHRSHIADISMICLQLELRRAPAWRAQAVARSHALARTSGQAGRFFAEFNERAPGGKAVPPPTS